jgi:hypothetical protein
MQHRYTDSQIDFITNHVIGRSRKELTELFNSHFMLELKQSQIVGFIKNNGLTNGLNARFKPDRTPFNKGQKGTGGWEPTQFKPGHRPHNYKPVGTERVNGEGYVDIKVADPNKWKGKHIITWEQHNGSVPKGHAILFGDRNLRNFDINNLILVSKRQLSTMNSKGLIQNNADLTRTGVIMADIYQKLSDRKRRK